MAEQHRRRAQISDISRRQTAAVREPAEDAEDIDLLELACRVLGSWKPVLCVALLFALAAGAATAFLIPPTYEATATLYVLGRGDAAVDMSDLQIGSALMNDCIKVFSLWEVHEQVISSLNLPYTYAEMKERLSVSNDPGTRMLDITVRSTDPVEAASVANAYADVAGRYIAEMKAPENPDILSVALVPESPVSPGAMRSALVAFIAGAVLAITAVTLRLILDDRYRTAEDIRRYTGLRTLAVVPRDEPPQDERGAEGESVIKA